MMPSKYRSYLFKRLLAFGALALLTAAQASADTRLIIRVNGGQFLLTTACRLLGCTVQYPLGDDQGQLFLVTSPIDISGQLRAMLGIVTVELDSTGLTSSATQTGAPAALYDSTPAAFYGTTVRAGYLNQPAAGIIRSSEARSAFHVSGAGIVAVIDTGVDTTHPALANVLETGYDFTRNRAGGDEKGDTTQSTTAVIDQTKPAVVNQSTTAVIDTTTAAQLNQQQYRGFGHGTMSAGVVHLVAPTARIMPLKAFRVDGSGYASDVIRAIYYAVHHHARVLNMSFSFDSASWELYRALLYARLNGVISVASTGNDGKNTTVYPAGFSDVVMGVASTSNSDVRSSFSNYGTSMTWVAAPGEGVVTLYPYSSYAAAWGTSFSAPFAAGAAALMLDVQPTCEQYQAAQAIGHARYIDNTLGHGRLDVYSALQSWWRLLGNW